MAASRWQQIRSMRLKIRARMIAERRERRRAERRARMRARMARMGRRITRPARDLRNRFTHGGSFHCAGCNRDFRNQTQFNAHSYRHMRQQDRALRGRQKGRGRKSGPSAPRGSRATEHAHDTLRGAGLRDEEGKRTTIARARPDEPVRRARDLKDRARYDRAVARLNRPPRTRKPRLRTARAR